MSAWTRCFFGGFRSNVPITLNFGNFGKFFKYVDDRYRVKNKDNDGPVLGLWLHWDSFKQFLRTRKMIVNAKIIKNFVRLAILLELATKIVIFSLSYSDSWLECYKLKLFQQSAPLNLPADSCSDGIYPVRGKCDAFYTCENGTRSENQLCPEGLLFNEFQQVCDWPHLIDCSDYSVSSESYYEGSASASEIWLGFRFVLFLFLL